MYPETVFSLDNNFALIESELIRQIEKFGSSLIKEASLYSCVETSGKKIRPILFLETLKLFRSDIEHFIPIAAAIEMCHVYSLIHDDLPSLDNDDTRRGKPSCHRKFNEGVALLTGNALLTHSFEIFSVNSYIPPATRCILIEEFAKSIGSSGMMAGQVLDLELRSGKVSVEEIRKLHRLKTGKLIEFSCWAAAVICSANKEEKSAISNFALNLGIVFQITDDIIDYGQTKSSECNIVDQIGLEEAQAILSKTVNDAILSLDIFGDKANILKSLVLFVLSRKI